MCWLLLCLGTLLVFGAGYLAGWHGWFRRNFDLYP
jgi:hypothetical protein